jgi:hypothetical protein
MKRCQLSTVVIAGLFLVGLGVAAPNSAVAGDHCCPPPPVKVTLCVDDPCDPCPAFPVTVCVPGCCADAPCVSWRNGAFGRRVATYVWPSCGHRVDVVVTRRGEVIVRD